MPTYDITMYWDLGVCSTWTGGFPVYSDPEGGLVTTVIVTSPSWLTLSTSAHPTSFHAGPLLIADIGTNIPFTISLYDGANTPVQYSFSVHVVGPTTPPILSNAAPVT